MIGMETKLTHRTGETKKHLQSRLHVIEGQVRGVEQMVEDDRYCGDILIQISAITKSLKTIAYEILKNHMSTCVTEKIKEDDPAIIDETIDCIKKINI